MKISGLKMSIESWPFNMRIQKSEERTQKKNKILVVPAPDFYRLNSHASLCLTGMSVFLHGFNPRQFAAD